MSIHDQIRQTIIAALPTFAAEPFFNVREADPQAELLCSLRSSVQPSHVEIQLKDKAGNPVPPKVRTSRVHAEMKIEGSWIDLVVLRSDTIPTLQLRAAGALDVIAPMDRHDLCALIEIKASPSSTQTNSYLTDLLRLSQLTEGVDDCLGFFVLFDKSLRLQGRNTGRTPNFSWTRYIKPNPRGRVEAHWLDIQGRTSVLRGDVITPPRR